MCAPFTIPEQTNTLTSLAWQSRKNGAEARVLLRAQRRGGSRPVAGAVTRQEPGQELIADVVAAAAETEAPRAAAGALHREIGQPEAHGGALAAEGGTRRNRRARLHARRGKVGPVDERTTGESTLCFLLLLVLFLLQKVRSEVAAWRVGCSTRPRARVHHGPLPSPQHQRHPHC